MKQKPKAKLILLLELFIDFMEKKGGKLHGKHNTHNITETILLNLFLKTRRK